MAETWCVVITTEHNCDRDIISIANQFARCALLAQQYSSPVEPPLASLVSGASHGPVHSVMYFHHHLLPNCLSEWIIQIISFPTEHQHHIVTPIVGWFMVTVTLWLQRVLTSIYSSHQSSPYPLTNSDYVSTATIVLVAASLSVRCQPHCEFSRARTLVLINAHAKYTNSSTPYFLSICTV